MVVCKLIINIFLISVYCFYNGKKELDQSYVHIQVQDDCSVRAVTLTLSMGEDSDHVNES